MTVPLDFEAARDSGSESWSRARPLDEETIIVAASRGEWIVKLADGSPHTVSLQEERGAYVGGCDCEATQYRDDEATPCAHLCTVRKAALGRVEDKSGAVVRVPDDAEATDHAVERVMADGGRGEQR